MFKNISHAATLLFIAIFLSGCATIMTGPTQKVPVTSTPSGAVAKVDGMTASVTPCTFTLERKNDHTIEISKEGYMTATVVLRHTLSGATAGNALIGGIIGVAVDGMSGAMYKLVPERVDVVLEPAERGAASEKHVEAEQKTQLEEQASTQTTPTEAEPSVIIQINADTEHTKFIDFVKAEVENYLVSTDYANEGEVWIRFTISPSGGITGLKIIDEKTTGSSAAKDACISAINTLYPFKTSQEDMPQEPIAIEMGIIKITSR